VYDLVIDDAVLVDGLGGPARPGGLAVQDGRIAAMGPGLGPARTRVDAQGLVLAPGIVDIHTHYDARASPTASATGPGPTWRSWR
jgi:N-acyl-D-aspartate/D-glutamate deacylase